MNIKVNKTSRRSGFSLVEMIGVLAIIAILASMLIPRVFAAINRAKISNSVLSINSIKASVTEAYSETGNFTHADGSAIVPGDCPLEFDSSVLLPLQLIDKEFSCKIGVETVGVNEHQVMIDLPAAAGSAVDGTNVAYNFDGSAADVDTDGDGTDDASSNDVENDQYVVYAKIPGVAAQDALDFSQTLDGDALSAANNTDADLIGRVKYAAPANGITDVYVYIASR